MRKKEIAERLAEQTDNTPSAAADALDEAITAVLKNIRAGQHNGSNALQRLIDEARSGLVHKGRHQQP